MTEFSDAYQKAGAIERKQARKALETEIARQLTATYGHVWSKGKIAVKAAKMVEESIAAQRAHLN